MKKGAKLANQVDSKFAIFEGSGAAIPPIKTNKNIVLIGGWTGMSKHKIQYKIELHIEAIITFNNSLMEA